MIRVAGKPFTVSEYDHPAPSRLRLRDDAHLRDVRLRAGLGHDLHLRDRRITAARRRPDRILGYFDQNNHPAKWRQSDGRPDLPPGPDRAGPASATMRLPAPIWESYHFFPKAWQRWFRRARSVSSRAVWRSAISRCPPARSRVVEEGQPAEGQVHLQKAGSGQVYIAASPAAAVFAGYIGGETLKGGDVELRTEAFGNNFASVAAVATDGQPLSMSKRILVTVCGRVENQGMGWNDSRTSVGTNWGYGPTIAQYVPATLSLPAGSARKAFILDSTGKRVKDASAKIEGGRLVLSVQDTDQTLLYEIAE